MNDNQYGYILRLYIDALKQSHLLIAGQTGSGKSVIINGIIRAALFSAPVNKQLILIDPKKVELAMYRYFPHTIAYGSDPGKKDRPGDMIIALQKAEIIMDERYRQMQAAGRKKYDGGHIYVIIDELADLLDTCKGAAEIIARIGRLGRAANVHLIVATQYLGDAIPPQIKRNLSAVIALHTRTAADSRYLIERKGCEQLHIGECYYIRPTDDEPQKVIIPYDGDEAQAAEVERLRKWWNDPEHIIKEE